MIWATILSESWKVEITIPVCNYCVACSSCHTDLDAFSDRMWSFKHSRLRRWHQSKRVRTSQLSRLISRPVSTRFSSFLDEWSSLLKFSYGECFFWQNWSLNTRVEVTLKHPFAAQVDGDAAEERREERAQRAQRVRDLGRKRVLQCHFNSSF